MSRTRGWRPLSHPQPSVPQNRPNVPTWCVAFLPVFWITRRSCEAAGHGLITRQRPPMTGAVSKVWCPAVGRGASDVTDAGAPDSPAQLCGTIKAPVCVSTPVVTDTLGRRRPPKTEVAGASTAST